MWVVMLLTNFSLILICYKIYGRMGLYLWIPISTIIANIQVLKLVEIMGVEATLGNIVYASSFLATDILSENHDRKDAKRAIGIGFLSLLSLTLLMQMALKFTPSANDFSQESLQTIFGLIPRIALASIVAYIISQSHDIWAFHWIKEKTKGKKLWLRNCLSTMVSQAIDTIVFIIIAFWGMYEWSVLVEIFWTTYLLKWVVAAADTPFLYLARWMKKEGHDCPDQAPGHAL
nr:queuosine precursor transporter [Desulfotalea psychrophila]